MSLVSTFSMLLPKVEGNVDASNVLSIAACLGPQLIPRELVALFSSFVPQTVVDLQTSSQSNPSNHGRSTREKVDWFWNTRPLALQSAVALLEVLCVFKVKKTSAGAWSGFSVHRSICRWRLETTDAGVSLVSFLNSEYRLKVKLY